MAGFAHTLRDNGFKVGLAETRDALAILASPAALAAIVAQARVARAVLRDPFRLGAFRRGLRCLLAGPPHAAAAGLDGRAAAATRRRRGGWRKRRCRRTRSACRITSSGAPAATAMRRRTGAAAARAPRAPRRSRRRTSAISSIPTTWRATHALAARLARAMRARLVRREQARRRGRRLDLRRTIHRNVSHGGTPDRPRLAAPQDQAAAARHAARCLGLDEPLHGVLRPLPAWRRRRLPRSGSLRVPHPARACLAVAARPRRDARGRQAGA